MMRKGFRRRMRRVSRGEGEVQEKNQEKEGETPIDPVVLFCGVVAQRR